MAVTCMCCILNLCSTCSGQLRFSVAVPPVSSEQEADGGGEKVFAPAENRNLLFFP
jgi:hypothetical protein